MSLGTYRMLAPSLGLQEGAPDILLPAAAMPESTNIQIINGEAHRSTGRGQIASALPGGATDKILHYHLHKSDLNVVTMFAFTKNNAYKWDSGTSAWVAWLKDDNANEPGHATYRATATDATEWSTANFGDYIIATNNTDKIMVATASAKFDWLDTDSGLDIDGGTTYCTRARFVKVFENYVTFYYTVEGGTTYSKRKRWSDLGVHNVYDTGDAGAMDLALTGPIHGVHEYQSFMLIVSEQNARQTYLTQSDEIFASQAASTVIGTLSPGSFVTAPGGEVFYLAADKTIRNVQGQVISQPVEKTLAEIPRALLSRVKSSYMRDFKEIWWAIPNAADSTDNDLVLVYNLTLGAWSNRSFPVFAFGEFVPGVSYTIDTLPYASIDAWPWPTIDYVDANSSFSIPMVSGASGLSYAAYGSSTDAGSSFEGYAVFSTDLTGNQVPEGHKRIWRIKLIFRNQGTGTVSLSVKADHNTAWTSVGSVNLMNTDEIFYEYVPCDIVGRNFLFKISASNRFRFLGMVIDYSTRGDRA